MPSPGAMGCSAMIFSLSLIHILPGVLPDEECFTEESHWNGLLEYPQYSRPDEWHGRRVPDVLLSGHHGNVEKLSLIHISRRNADAAVNVEQLDLLQKALRAAADAVLQRADGDTLGAHHGDIACNSGELRQRPVDGDTAAHGVERVKAQLSGIDPVSYTHLDVYKRQGTASRPCRP